MADKLNYATPKRSARRTQRERMIDMLAGSSLVLSGLFSTIFLSLFTRNLDSQADEWFEKPRRRIYRGIMRIAKGHEAARSCRP